MAAQMIERCKTWIWQPPFRWGRSTRLDLLLALLLSAVAEIIVSGFADKTNPRGGVFACAAVLLMTLPVAVGRPYPLGAMTTLAGGAVFNAIVVGSYVRCAAALPALALVLFLVATRCELRTALVGAGLALASTVAQGLSDPQLTGDFLPIGAILVIALWGIGRLVRSRDGLVATLRGRTRELHAQRDRTAQLAVAADRARVAEDLDGMLGARIGRLAAEAAVAHDAMSGHPEAAREALMAIEREGRRTLSDMREIVGGLHEEPPVASQPTLDDLERLLKRTLPSSARVKIQGERHRLPAGVELSAFRIIERLLEPLADDPDVGVQVTLSYEPERLAVEVLGRLRAGADLETTLATAREWVALNAGMIQSRSFSGGVARTGVRLPLITAHA